LSVAISLLTYPLAVRLPLPLPLGLGRDSLSTAG
jgi:hypothetical protein